MKNSKDKVVYFRLQKYAKQLCLETILLILLSACHLGLSIEDEKSAMSSKDSGLPVHPASLLTNKPILGVEQLDLFLDSLKGKRIAIVGNQTSLVNNIHLVDTLLSLDVNVVKVFCPEHGFRGDLDAGEKVGSSIDKRTGLPLVSLYGSKKKPTNEDLRGIDIVLFDIQDVGVRFYTFLSTLHYVMEACAQNNKQLVVLDRPNPNAHYIDGPVLEIEFSSFVGLHPVPIVYGMTIGEYALMINGEGWLGNNLKCDLKVIPCNNYTHQSPFELTISPSPNLKSKLAISLYPSLCLFEATTVSVGRGTDNPFEIYGHPHFPKSDFSFIPSVKIGSKKPLHLGFSCNGFRPSFPANFKNDAINLDYLIHARNLLIDSFTFIDQDLFFNNLAGTATLKKQLYDGWTAKDIRATWQPGLEAFRAIRKKYLLYN